MAWKGRERKQGLNEGRMWKEEERCKSDRKRTREVTHTGFEN